MIIDKSETIAGVPVLAIRDLLRKSRAYFGLSQGFVEDVLAVSSQEAATIIDTLHNEGFIESAESHHAGRPWHVTLKGGALALAKATKPIKRATAERKLEELLQRARVVASSSKYLYKVTKIIIFGSFLTAAERLGDLDVAIEMRPKVADRNEFHRLCEEKINEAYRQGREFRSYSDELYWPEREVKLFLKSRSTAISLHSSHDPILDQIEQKLVYEDAN